MARLVRHTANGPYKIEPQDLKPIFICGCGLSRTMPFCDGTHKGCRSEEPGKLYVYNADRSAVEQIVDDATSTP
jgi:CDGSH-type Zn-finger protein